MKLLVMASGYPTLTEPEFPFVGELVKELASQGVEAAVISPQSITAQVLGRKTRRPPAWTDATAAGVEIPIRQPRFLSFSKSPLTPRLRARAYEKALTEVASGDSVLFCYFWNTALEVSRFAVRRDLPVFVSTGESTIDVDGYTEGQTKSLGRQLRGVVAVSTKNKDESVALGLCSEKLVRVIPNAADASFFEVKGKATCRERLGIGQDDFVLLFVGHFSERKGIARLCEALDGIQGVSSVFLGSGEIEPRCRGVVFAGRVPHDDVPLYLGAADVLVLPTLAEGCSNAIVEALAAGLPVVSSDLPFNWDILDDTCSVLVDPRDIGAIRRAIVEIRDDREFRERLSRGAFEKARDLRLDVRASKIISFIQERCGLGVCNEK